MRFLVARFIRLQNRMEEEAVKALTDAWEPFVTREAERNSPAPGDSQLWTAAGWSYSKQDFVGLTGYVIISSG